MAVIYAPGYFTVVAFTAELAVDDSRHSNIVATSPHVEYFRVTHIAGKAEPMKPVGKYDWPHPFLIGVSVKNHISIFPSRHRWKHRPEYQRYG
jgi:hypothetical protein